MDTLENDWELLTAGDLAGAYDAATRNLIRQPHTGAFAMNRGTSLLAQGCLEEALADFRLAGRLFGDSDAARGRIGVTLWWLGRREEAVVTWRGTDDAGRTAIPPGIEPLLFLTFAAVRLGDVALAQEVERLLRRRWRPYFARGGTGSIVGLLLGAVDAATLLAGQIDPHPVLERRRACRAHFWAGMVRERAGDHDSYLQHLQRAAAGDDCQSGRVILLEDEYWLARAELAALAGAAH